MPRNYNLILAAIWLFLAVLLLAPEDAIAPKLAKNLGGPLKLPVAILALVLTAYNVVRWWSFRSLSRGRTTPAPNPLAPRRDREGEEYERNPELDFLSEDKEKQSGDGR
jgi:hypothetical protein